MPSLFDRDVVLVMREGLAVRTEHVDCMHRLGLRIHVMTQEPAECDPRFASVRHVPGGLPVDRLADLVLDRLRATGSTCAVTFQETDIVGVGRANERFGVPWARPGADATARDKSRQRRLLAVAGLPSPACLEVRDADQALHQLTATGDPWPVVIKPTHAAGSSHVRLVHDREEALRALRDIEALADGRLHNFYDQRPPVWALIEEFLPGEEVTCDGVVINGEFHLGGVHHKELGAQPWFEEDLYTLPFADDPAEAEIVAVATGLARALDLQHCLLNLELRRDAAGRFRVVEFSTRISGGHVYRNILDVHAIDLVELFLRAVFGDAAAGELATRRHPGRLATCIRMVYRTGTVVTNHAGAAQLDPEFRGYYPLAAPGSRVASAPVGFDICGLLSVRGRLDPERHPHEIRATARRLERLLEIDVRSDPVPSRLTAV